MPIIPQTLAHIVTTGSPTHIYSDPDLAAVVPSTLPAGKQLRKFGGLPGWQFVQITYGIPPIPQYAWLKSDEVASDPQPLTVIDGVCP